MTGFWIGGSPCAGKSSIAARLARRHGLRHIECDRGSSGRRRRMTGRSLPAYDELSRLGICDRLARPPDWQCRREVQFYREQFPFLLAELPDDPSGLVEGADLLPELLCGVAPDRAVWIVPTPEFQLRHYAERDWVRPYLAGCPDPDAAFDNWMRRDVLFAGYVRTTAERFGGRVIVVDGSRSLDETVADVEQHFDLRPGKTVGG